MFDVVIHITSRAPDDDGVNLEELVHFTEDPGPPGIGHGLEMEVPASAPRDITNDGDQTFKLSKTMGIPFQEGQDVPQWSILQNFHRFLWLAATVAVCLAAHQLHYDRYASHRSLVMARTYIIVYVLVITLSLRILQLLFLRHPSSFFSLLSARHFPHSYENTEVLYNEGVADGNDRSQDTVESGEPYVVQRRIRFHSGRPLMSDVVAPVGQARYPGAIFCGPTKLRDSVKGAIQRERHFAKGNGRGVFCESPACAFYDEQSEM